MKNLKSYLRERVKDYYENDEYGEFSDLHYELFNNVENWPEVKEDEDGDDDDTEPLDMENFEWVSIDDDELVIACGGDWQEPLTVTMHFNGENLVVVYTEEGYTDGLSEDEFNDLLGL